MSREGDEPLFDAFDPGSGWADADERARRGRALLNQRRFEEAADQFRTAIAINPAVAEWHFHLGRTLDELGRLEDAVSSYETAIELEPDDPHTLNRLGVDLHGLGRFAEAAEALERIEEIDSSFVAAYGNRILVYAELGDHDRAKEMFYLALQYDERSPQVHFNMGRAMAVLGRFEQALALYEIALRLPDAQAFGRRHVHRRLAEVSWRLGKLEQARRHYSVAFARGADDAAAMLDFVDLLLETHRTDEAAYRLADAERLWPGLAAVKVSRAGWLVHAGRCDEAAGECRQALALDPTCPRAHLLLGRIAMRRNDLEFARQHFLDELAVRGDGHRVLMELGNALLDAGLPRAAAEAMRRLVSLEPFNANGWQNLAVAECEQFNWSAGLAAGEQAIALHPDNIAPRHNLVLALLRCGRLHDAAVQLDRARQIIHFQPHRALDRLALRLRVARVKRAVGRFLNRGIPVP